MPDASDVATLPLAIVVAAVVVAHQRWRRRQQQLLTSCARNLAGPALAPASPPLPTSTPPAPRAVRACALALTASSTALIGDSMPFIASAEAAKIFYDELFELAPELRQLFGCVSSQQRKLVGMLQWVGASLGDAPRLVEGLRALGARHVKYGSRLYHFCAIKAAFLRMVQIVDQQTLEARAESVAEHGPPSPAGAPAALAEPLDRHARLLGVSRAWEALLYVFIGEMGPAMLMAEDLAAFRRALANGLAAPAGGTCAALSGAQGAALLAMSAELTRAPVRGSAERARVDAARDALRAAAEALEALAGLDLAAYCTVMAAVRQPPLDCPSERTDAIARALYDAASVPLLVAEWAAHALCIARSLLPLAAQSGVGDAAAGVQLLLACARTAVRNCQLNTAARLALGSPWRAHLEARARELCRTVAALGVELAAVIDERTGVPSDSEAGPWR
ncbi:hypothetical protein KFE25_007707 [Diacronema lutheri]|uniref:Globin domain-containing protein n=1 Tax=Diacronema lutheri TaxID=2081491 RepID=A0A8J5Y0R9_DIALT|nr:hypothetical protein KFE25_007707 [Diacronema lutheri]